MLVPNQVFNIRVNASSIKHYQSKGYENLTMNCFCDVKAEDLSSGSKISVKMQCDYCGKIFEKVFGKLLGQRSVINKDSCFECFPLKQKEVIQEKYGCDSVTELETFKEKSKTTNLRKLGTENAMSSKQTQRKFRATMQHRYGCDYAQQNPQIRAKTEQTFLDNYGVKSPLAVSSIREAYQENFKFVNGVRVSKTQISIANYLKGLLNVYIEGFYVDILLEDNIVIEYNGSGHSLKVHFGTMTQVEFDEKETFRMNLLNEKGYSVIAIENPRDLKINLEVIKAKVEVVKNEKLQYLQYYVS